MSWFRRVLLRLLPSGVGPTASPKRGTVHLASLAAFLVATFFSGWGQAQPLRFHGTAGGAHAVTGDQSKELGLGAFGMAAGEYAFSPEFGLALEAGWLWLGQGDPPADPGLERLSAASAFSAAGGLRYRPFASHFDGDSFGTEGFWLGGGIGVAATNGLKRLFFDAHLGYDFMMKHAQFGIGPAVGLYHVSQPDDAIRPDDANILLCGVHAVFDLTGVPEPAPSDRDGDGIVDEADDCPDRAEDKDGFEDEDGCPDEDNDRDGIPDTRDDCPNVPEDKDGFEDLDGCPDDDNDKDGVLDSKDACPDDAEDKDGFEDEDGCPDEDNDRDGIVDAQDLCPDEPETKNGYADHDGCPDEERVRVLGDKIVLDDRVHFRTNSHIIRVVSYPLLSRLAKLLRRHPEYIHVSIEGHADSRGTEEYNQRLSEKRAASVMEFLERSGIARERMSSKGFGETRPLAEKDSEDAWLLNRRVEFVVTRATKKVEHSGGPSEQNESAPEQKAEPAQQPGATDVPKDQQQPEPAP